MSHGIATYASNGEINLLSTALGSSFFHQSITASADTPINSTGFSDYGAMVTAGSTSSLNLVAGFTGSTLSAPGAHSQELGKYASAKMHKISGQLNPLDFVAASPIASVVSAFGARSTASGGYGGMFRAADSTLLIDEGYKTMYLQPTAEGVVIRSAVAVSSAPLLYPGFNSNISFAPATNVAFGKAYSKPPLIFVTSSGGPISFAGMQQDGSGRYTGAAIVANSGFTYSEALTTNSYSFNYFLVSEEEPLVGSCGYGMKIFSSSGQTVFDSSYYCPSIRKLGVPTPYISASISGAGISFPANNSSSFYFSSKLGACINNCQAFSGAVIYPTSIVVTGSGTLTFFSLPIVGRYLHVNQSAGVVSLYSATTVVANNQVYYEWGANYPYGSYDFSYAECPTMGLFYSDYTRL